MTNLKGWISTEDRLPKNSYTLPFLLIVKNEENDCCQIMTGEWSCFAEIEDTFTCWCKTCINGLKCKIRQPLPIERVLYWRPLLEVPDDIKGKLII